MKCNKKKNLNDKYILYSDCIENTKQQFNEFGSLTQKRFFEIKQEEFSLKNQNAMCVKGN